MTVRQRFVVLVALGAFVGLPALARAQASIAGTVKDTSGAVLPGVTVEASSPVLIEKSRTVVTDSTGQYKIVDLRPGTYTVAFTLTGFNTVKREGIELTGSFTATVNPEMRVGALEETITVTGETPVVDVQSATKERVLSRDVIDSLPGGSKTYATLGALVPAVALAGGTINQDVGGSFGGAQVTLTVHGSKADDTRIMQNGLATTTLVGGGALGGSSPNPAAAQEVTIDTGSVSAELATGGPRINYIPRDGGNIYSGFAIGSFTNSSLQSNNLTSDLQARGLTRADSVKSIWDFNPGLGGPVKKDKVWFFFTARHFGSNLYSGSASNNVNALDVTKWNYVADTNSKVSNDQTWKDGQLRVTWQATPRNKFAFTGDWQTRCSCPGNAGIAPPGLVLRSPEAAQDLRYPLQRLLHAEWSSPVTNRLLLEAVAINRIERFTADLARLEGYPAAGMISVAEQSNNSYYRASPSYGDTVGANYAFRVGLSYITGAHAVKIGLNDSTGYLQGQTFTVAPVSYRFNGGTPNQVTIWDAPYTVRSNQDADWGMFFQDKWTLKRWTVSYGVRYDNWRGSYPEQHLGPTTLLPNQNLTLAEESGINWKDVTPHFSGVWDMFGNGKTAVKFSANKYLRAQALGGLAQAANPVSKFVLSTTRTWTDANSNFVVDCNVATAGVQDNRAAGGDFCGQLSNTAFGQQGTSTFDPDLLTGWNHRQSNWEFSAGVQQQLAPRVAVDISYFRRIYGNFQVTDNLKVTPSDYTTYSITAPVDSRLPGGGGYTVSGLVDLNSNKLGQVSNYNTLSDKYGKQIEHWNGVDINANARLANGVLIQGGVSVGRTVTDDCEVVAQLPEMLAGLPVASNTTTVTTLSLGVPVLQPTNYCHMEEPWITQFKMLGSYTFPKIDVQVSGTVQSVPGPVVQANYVVTSAVASPSLGRNLTTNTQTVNLVKQGTMYGDRLNQLDLRVAKNLRVQRMRVAFSADLYNALNVSTVTFQQDAFATWQQPLATVQGRFVKFGAQITF